MADEIKVILLEREPNTHSDGSVPGWLHVGDRKFPTIERGQGYTSYLVGDYRMQHAWKTRGRRIQCLSPIEGNIAYKRDGEKDVRAVLIHAAQHDSSLALEGCVSPGLTKKPKPGMGILGADQAMAEIFALLGTFQEGKTVVLHVLNNVPGVTGMKETWGRVQTLSIRRLMGWRAPKS